MIEKITLKNTASYKAETSLETDKEINLIYGLNGSGKTVLSNYLKNQEEPKFSECSIEGFDTNNQKILVYNQKFITENFYESETQKGVFTLARENKEALEKINKAQQEKGKLNNKLVDEEHGYFKQLKDKKSKIEKTEKDIKEKTWEIKTAYKRDDMPFDKADFLTGVKGSKDELFNRLMKCPLLNENKTIESIEKELLELTDEADEREELNPIEIDFADIEKNSIFQKEIVGAKSSTLAKLITELQNSDWVKEGIAKYVDLAQRKNCPFCQEETLTEELVQNIKNYFDQSYEKDIGILKGLKEKYTNLKAPLSESDYIKYFFSDKQKLTMQKCFQVVSKTIEDNLKEIEKKINSPSLSIRLSSSTAAIEKLNKHISEVNKDIQEFNLRIQNRKQEIKKLKIAFWNRLRQEYNSEIKNYEKRDKQLQSEKKGIEEKIAEIESQIRSQDDIIKQNQSQITNIKEVIDKINRHLMCFGIDDFEITEHNKKEYKIQRGRENDKVFQSLSEGEKMVISFLYFVELCQGLETETDTKKKIVVIDDPVSSLSHMYVFNVAQLIKTYFLKKSDNNFLQVFILTHSLYFFNELYNKRGSGRTKLFRISKGDSSTIQTMKKDEIQNEYHSYWSIIREGQHNPGCKIAVANAMRNVLEYFFGFIDKSQKLADIFERSELSNNKYQAFKRYMDRESHSTVTNLSDFKEFDHKIFNDAFKQVFKSQKHEKHYNQMMEIN